MHLRKQQFRVPRIQPKPVVLAATVVTITLVITLANLCIVAGRTPGGKASADEVTISHNDLRDGWDPDESRLSPAVLSGGKFGRLFSASVVGKVTGQPIVAGTTLIVGTSDDWVYGLDAGTGKIRWSVEVGKPWSSSGASCNSGVAQPCMGIRSTPVYDPATGTIYVVAEVVSSGTLRTNPAMELVGVNVATGSVSTKVLIAGSPVNDPSRIFTASQQNQRTGLLMMNGWVYIGFASQFSDRPPYSGYIVGVQPAKGVVTLWSDESGKGHGQGGIWQSGSGLMSDGTDRIFFSSGNGSVPSTGPGLFSPRNSPQSSLGNAVVRLQVLSDGSLQAADFFSPANANQLNQGDRDFGSGGPVGLSFGTARWPHLLVQAGKDGRVYLLNRDDLGGRAQGPNGTDAVVNMSGPFRGQWGHPAAFGSETTVTYAQPGADFVYCLGRGDYLRALRFLVSQSGVPYLADAGESTSRFAYPPGSPVVTSDGTDPSSAVIWVISPAGAPGVGILQAFAAMPQAPCSTTVASPCLRQLWSAPVGAVAHFAVPATDHDRVYVGTVDGHVMGFGITDG